MKYPAVILLVVLIFASGSEIQAQDYESGSINIDNAGIAIHGYDPVEYHLTNRAVPGDSSITLNIDGAVFYFRNVVNRKLFMTLPQKYTPAYGGFCAFGLAFDEEEFNARRGRYKVDPQSYKIVQGKLLLFYPEREWTAKKFWNRNEERYLQRADEFWAVLEGE